MPTWTIDIRPTDLPGVGIGVDLHHVLVTFSPSTGSTPPHPDVRWSFACTAPVPIYAVAEDAVSPTAQNRDAIHSRVGQIGNLAYGALAGQVAMSVWPAGTVLTATITGPGDTFPEIPSLAISAWSAVETGPAQTVTVAASTVGGTAATWSRTGPLRGASLPAVDQGAINYDTIRIRNTASPVADARLTKRPDRVNPSPQDWLIRSRRDTITFTTEPGFGFPAAGLTMVATTVTGDSNPLPAVPATITPTAIRGAWTWNTTGLTDEPYALRFDAAANSGSPSVVLRTTYPYGVRPTSTAFGGLLLACIAPRDATARAFRVSKGPYELDRIPVVWTQRTGTFYPTLPAARPAGLRLATRQMGATRPTGLHLV